MTDDDDFSLSYNNRTIKNMKDELKELKKNHENPSDLDEFFKIYKRFLSTRYKKISWNEILPPKGKIIDYFELDEIDQPIDDLLSKLAVLKLNGGLGTTMGLNAPKSSIKVRQTKNFLDLTVQQLECINRKHKCNIPLVLMNSFNTKKVTTSIVKSYDNILMFNQSKAPKISKNDFMPISGDKAFFPPGHGDLFYSINKCGMLDKLIEDGKEYLFVSNVDNLSATVDEKLLNYFARNKIDFMMEVTKKTRSDIKGGTLVNYKEKLKLLEIAEVPKNKKSEFTSVRKFKIFNTNSIWIDLKAIKKLMDEGGLELDIIQNNKIVNDENVIQLETALGSAIKYFSNSCGIVVPRSRFLPVKTCSDLFIVESNLFEEFNGNLLPNKHRQIEYLPDIRLIGSKFQKIEPFEEAFKSIPDILDLERLTVSGNVKFGTNVTLKGNVIIFAGDGDSIEIPDGSILDDKIIVGNLTITDI